ncbi:Hypothetical protein NTJ_09212 [Nesidiocoris tenuis]|uniref:Ig-like domain-containing protein n=1 Tax=Nesidiocoris tenuis TaxID=355587 RepID=A0ABN7AW18_9HEMI|nr:Hypothetical protein NTJ_09212 [Nesidiocoris tenuis]
MIEIIWYRNSTETAKDSSSQKLTSDISERFCRRHDDIYRWQFHSFRVGLQHNGVRRINSIEFRISPLTPGVEAITRPFCMLSKALFHPDEPTRAYNAAVTSVYLQTRSLVLQCSVVSSGKRARKRYAGKGLAHLRVASLRR